MLVIALCVASPARAAEKAIWGPTTLPGGESAFPTYKELGVDTLQTTINWFTVAPSRPADAGNPNDPAYRWPAALDEMVQQARRHGVDVALNVQTAPPWANGGRSAIWAPTNPGDYAEFVSAVSRRYPSIRRWMIWSEPNKASNFQPSGDPISARTYAPILEAAYHALKSESRQNTVIGGMTWTGSEVTAANFLSSMRLPDGRPPRLDWYGHNPFPYRYPDLSKEPAPGGYRDISDLDTLESELRSVYGRTVRFWLSEFTISSDRASREFVTFVSRENQASWLRAAYRIADRQAPVAGMGWIGLVDAPGPNGSLFGLLTTSLERKPAFDAFRDAPSVRHTPTISVARRISSGRLGERGLGIRVRPRTPGRVTIELRRRGRRVLRTQTDGRQQAQTVRLRGRRRARGIYDLMVRSPRGETYSKRVRVTATPRRKRKASRSRRDREARSSLASR